MAFHALFAETLWGILREHLLDFTFPGGQDEEPPRRVGLRRQVLQFFNGGQYPEDFGLHQNGTGETQDAVVKGGAKIIPASEIDRKGFVAAEKPVWDQFTPTPDLKALVQEIVNAK